MVDETVAQWLAVRKAAAADIDPATAEVTWVYAQTLDPYGVDPELPEECQQVGREYFARVPDSDIWVHFGDLPERYTHSVVENAQTQTCISCGAFLFTRR